MTISFEKGLQVLDGKKALQYARSRHTTSDFSRSYRQQQVIQAMLHTLTSMSNIVNPSTLSQLYTTLTTYIHTNITFQEILGMGVYIYKPRQIFSYVYSADCDNMSYEMVNP
jgi:anionic cell wall polymer biosynthesis LytR-Cps2A-Psr (LCP) family protein